MTELHSRPLRILMVNHHRRSKVNCINRSLAMARYLVRRGHQVTLLTTADNRKIGIVENWEDGVHIVEIPDLLWGSLRSGWDPWSALMRLYFLLHCETQFDLIHLFESRPAVIHPIQLYRLKRSLPVIIDWVDRIGRGGILEVRRPRWYRLMFGGMETFYEEHFRARADGVTVICTALLESARALGISQDAILHIPVGVDLDTYPSVLDKAVCRSAVGLPHDTKILAFAGMDANFDLLLVINAFARVVEQYPDARLMLIGKDNPSLLEVAKDHGIEELVISTGYVPYDSFPTYLGCADIFLLPFPGTIYNAGRWPSKICDYMASGRPIVSNPTGDIAVLFEKYNVGLLADDNADDFSKKIIRLLDDPILADKLGRNARLAAESDYEWGKLIKELENFYYKILKLDTIYDNQA